ncbi:hypothetical protein HU200_021885 [Digitaria exilis]|uniref:Uncharacterized protein n=1 Tax=Digitaria exilis TaxID=1010633 RepID=A0A835KD28_9POAL|nr:hypothetical protein HU200_021885 [Digitaria exilis]
MASPIHRVAALEDASADEDAVASKLHHECGAAQLLGLHDEAKTSSSSLLRSARTSLSAQVTRVGARSPGTPLPRGFPETLDRVRELGARHLAPTFQTSKPPPPLSFFLSSLSFLSSAPSGRSQAPPPTPLLRPPAPCVGADPHDVGEGKKKWNDRAQKNYPDVSSKDAPCGKPARVTQSMHPDTAARAYYKCAIFVEELRVFSAMAPSSS